MLSSTYFLPNVNKKQMNRFQVLKWRIWHVKHVYLFLLFFHSNKFIDSLIFDRELAYTSSHNVMFSVSKGLEPCS